MMYIIFKDEAKHWVMIREDQIRFINYSDSSFMMINSGTRIVYFAMLTSLYTYEEAASRIATIAIARNNGDDEK